jgi:hypothetical protein
MSPSLLATLVVATSLCAFIGSATTPVTNFGNLTLVADGYVWIENIWVNPQQDEDWLLFFSDSFRGEVVRVSSDGNFTNEVWVTGFYRVLGFSPSQNKSELFAVGWTTSTEYHIIAMNVATPQTWRVVATTDLGGNGLGIDLLTNTLYTASEGDFIPGNGVVFSMNMTDVVGKSAPSTNQSIPALYDHGLTAADGLWVDTAARRLYVSEVLNATVRCYDISRATPTGGRAELISTYHAPGMDMLDDFSVATAFCGSGTATMFGADFWAGKVFSFNADGTNLTSTELVSGLSSPTSVRPGPLIGGRTLYISEGGGLDVLMNNRRLWRLTLGDQFQC